METSENDEALLAEANMNNQEPSPPLLSYKARAANRDTHPNDIEVDSQKTADYEDSPLLDRSHRSGYSSLSSTLDEEEDRPPPAIWSGGTDFEDLPWWKRPSVYWLLPPFLVFTLAFGGVVVPKLQLIVSLICEEYLEDRSSSDPDFTFLPVVLGNNNPQCQIPEVQALVANFTLYIQLIGGSLAAITSPKLGALSDRYGRTKLIALTTFGLLLGEIITILCASYPEMFSYRWLLLGYAVDGLFGSFIAAMAVTNAYASDVTEPSQRNVAFGYIHGCIFTGIAIGPVIAGYVVKATGSIVSIFYVALAAHLFFMTFLLLVVPESLSQNRQLAARQKPEVVGTGEGYSWNWTSSWKRFSRPTGDGQNDSEGSAWVLFFQRLAKGGGFFTPLTILWPSGPGSSRAVRRNLVFLAAVDTTMFGVAMGSLTIVIIYAIYKFHWDTFQSSIFMSIVNTCRVTILLVVLPLITRLVRGPASRSRQRPSGSDQLDLAIIRVAIIFDMIGYIGYATSRTGSMLIASGAFAAVGGMGSPTLQSALTKHVPPERTGQLLGAVGLLHALARVIGPVIFNRIYAITVVRDFPQAVFICLAGTFGVAFLLSLFIRPHVYFDEPDSLTTRPTTAAGGENAAPEVAE